MPEDLLGDRVVADQRYQPHVAATPRADRDVHSERPLHQLVPLQAPRARGVVGASDVGGLVLTLARIDSGACVGARAECCSAGAILTRRVVGS